ncbi:hypothetical protein GQ55_8G151400 [Panicum hallii var. hallii]|uniref:Uncharacterized protein n=1 Tax=Panicum hallii var. hallii TaxID=1504633 RepID=A0A2T7CN61_9POAL|nr:hypothetical protein GQ55_8G151400 [Panicum hallii var. hallii]
MLSPVSLSLTLLSLTQVRKWEQRPRVRVPAAVASSEGAHGSNPRRGCSRRPPTTVHVTPLARKLLDGGSHAARLPQHAQDEGEPSVLSYGSWGRGRARAKAEPRLVLQICSHCAGKEKLYGKVADLRDGEGAC